MKASMVKRVAHKISLAKIFQTFGVLFAYQFGSTVLGYDNYESDVDIAVYFPEKLSYKQRFEKKLELMTQLSRYFQREVDVVILNDIQSLFLKFTIVREGKLLYHTPQEEYIDFECRLMSEYFDYQPFLETYNKHYVEKLLQ